MGGKFIQLDLHKTGVIKMVQRHPEEDVRQNINHFTECVFITLNNLIPGQILAFATFSESVLLST